MINRVPLSIMLSTTRFTFFFCIWLIVASLKLADLPIGIAAAALALWISLRLWPPHPISLRPVPIARLTSRLLGCSILAGVDVARRALLPHLDLRPGFVTTPLSLQSGGTRSAFSYMKAFSLEPYLRALTAIISRFTAWTLASRLLKPSRRTRACLRG